MKKSLFIFILIFCSALSFSQSLHGILLPIQEDGKWGLIDTSGKIVLKPQYDHIGLFGRYGFAISRKANKFGFISLHDRISEPVYDQVRVINENYVLLQEQQDWKIMKVSSGKLFFNLHQGNLLSEFQRGYFLWKQGEKLGVFDTAGQIVLPCEYDSIALMRYMKEVLIVKKNNLYGFNRLRDGRQLLAPLLKTYQRYGYHLVYKDEHGNTGLITGKGTVVSARWDEVSPMNDRMVQVRKGNKWGLVHSDNDSLIVKPAYDYFWYYHHSLVIGVKGGKWELINDQGKTIIPGKYEHIYKISEELAAVQQGKLWGLVREKNGEVVISPRYEYIGYDFNRFFLLSTYHGKKGMISLQGKVIHEPVFDDIDYFNESVKCYLGSRAILYKFNTKGEITAKFTPAEFCSLHMPYHVRVKHPGSRGGGCGGNYSNRIEYWYFDPRVKKWGFKYPRHTYHEDKAYYNYKDEIIVEPRFNEVDFYKDFVKVMQYSKIAGSNDSAMTYGIYERYAPQMVAPVRFSDINMKNLEIARVTGAKELNGSWVMISTEKEYPETIIPIISDHNNKYTLKGFGNFDRMTGLAPIKLKRENTDEPGRWGFSDVAGTVFIPPLYEDATDFRTFEIKSGHWTLIYVSDPSDTANILLSKEKWIREPGEFRMISFVKAKGKWGAIDQENRPVIDFIYDTLSFLPNTSDTLIQAEIFGHTYLFFDSLGSLISSREFEEAGDFCEGRARVKYQDLWTFIDEHGNFIPEPRFGEVYDYYQGAALVKEKSQWGLMNRDGKYIVPPQYSEARPFHDGWAAVQKEGKWLYINERGEAGGKLRFDEADDFLHGTARVKYKKKYGFVDRNLTWQVKPQFRKMSVPGGNGVIAVSNKKKENWFLVNRQGKRISDRTFLSAGTWSEGLASVSGRDSTGKIRFGFIDTTGNLVVGLLYDKVSDFHEGLAAALLNGKWGYIGLDGFVIQPVFQLAGNFDLGYAEVYLKDKKMYTDQKGNYYSKIVRLPRTEETQSTALSKADSLHGIVRENRSYGMVDSSGAFLIPPVYGKIYDFKNGIARTKSGSYKGVLSLNGRVILKPTYNYVTHLNNGIIRVEKNGKIGYYQKDCKWIWPLAE